MFSQLNLVIGAVVAVLLFGGGYSFGARKVDSLETQIEELRKTGMDADTVRKSTQTQIDKALKSQGDEHAKQVEALRADSERGRKDLAAALAGAKAEAEKQSAANAALRTKLGAAVAAAKPGDRAGLQAQLDEANRKDEALRAQSCLALAVPDAVIRPLMK